MPFYKAAAASVKATGDQDNALDEGQFVAIVSAFGNVDSYGDVVVPGAFTETLADWAAKGDPIPIYWSHRMDDPDYNIGYALEAVETEAGLQITGQLDLDVPKAAQVYRLLKGRRVTQFSFAYDVVEGAFVEQKREDGSTSYTYEIRKVDLYECGPCALGVNQETELLGVKSVAEQARAMAARVKAGRVLAQTHIDSLRGAQEAIGTVLAAAEAGTTEDDQEKASTSGPVKASAPDGAPADEPSRDVSVDDLAAIDITLTEMEGAAL